MSIKKDLLWLRHFDALLSSKKQELDSLRSEAYRTKVFLEMNEQKEKSETLNARVIDKTEEISQEILDMYAKRDMLLLRMEDISDPLGLLVVRLFYLERQSWRAIRQKLHFSIKHLQRKRDEALEEIDTKKPIR